VTTHQKSEAILRGARMLRTALGPAIARFLEDPAVVEVMLNPDGRLWIDRLSGGLADTGERLSPADGERIVRLVAHHVGAEVHPGAPRVSAELPDTGDRFEGLLKTFWSFDPSYDKPAQANLERVLYPEVVCWLAHHYPLVRMQ
jgi:type IV secretion system protein TrbB